MLKVSVAPGLLESETSMADRLFTFANRQAAARCGGKFNFVPDPNPEVHVPLTTQRSKVYVYRRG